MNDQELKATLVGLLRKIAPDVDPAELRMDDELREVYGIDSYDFLQFIIGLDETFGIETPEEDYGKITTLNALLAYIKSAT